MQDSNGYARSSERAGSVDETVSEKPFHEEENVVLFWHVLCAEVAEHVGC